MTDPLDRLAALGTGPVPPLAGAEAARARGAQRTRRARAALAGTGAVVAAVALTAGIALAGGGGLEPDTLPQANTPSPAVVEDALTAALLDAEDVSDALQEPWEVRPADDPAVQRGVPSCFPSVTGGQEAMRAFLGPRDRTLFQRIELLPDEAAAEALLAAKGEGSASCGSGQLVLDSVTEADTVRGALGTDSPRAFAFVRVDRAVVLVLSDDPTLPDDLLTRAREEVRAAVPSEPSPSLAPTPAPTPAPTAPTLLTAERDFDPLRALLTPEDAAQAEEPGWSVSTPADGLPSPLLDPCGDGQVPGSDAVASVAERAMSSEREAGGSLLQQVVYEFRDIASADQAFTAYREAYERCPASPSGESYYEEVQPAEDLSFLSGERLLVRQTSCPPGCNAPFASYAYVVRNTYAVTVARYEVGEDGDPAEPGRQLLRAVALAMNGAVYESTPVLGIRSPAGSTTCVLYVTGVACDTAAQFTPPPKPADCEFDWGSRVELDDEGARFSCHSDALGVEETASLLPYGATAQNEAFRCSSSTEGITCRQVAGDAGFRLSRGSYELFQG